jgi:hypothetical protein
MLVFAPQTSRTAVSDFMPLRISVVKPIPGTDSGYSLGGKDHPGALQGFDEFARRYGYEQQRHFPFYTLIPYHGK